MCLLVAGVFILQTKAAAKSCELVRSDKKTGDCFSEPECMEKCGRVKGENCRVEQEKQCKFVNKKQCKVVQEQVGWEKSTRAFGFYCVF